MRHHKPLGVIAAVAATTTAILTACASGPPSDPARMNAYAQEVEQIRAACEARGGTIIPTGRITGTPALDNPCRLREATNIPPAGAR